MGVKVWAEVLANFKVPELGIRLAKDEKSTVAFLTSKTEDPKFNPPPVMGSDELTIWIRPEPRSNVPAAIVKVGTEKLLVNTVVPPLPFCLRFKVVTPALGVKLWAEVPVNSKVLDPGVTLKEERLMLAPDTARLEVPKSSPPDPETLTAVWLNPEPRCKVPLVRVRLPAAKALVKIVVPPAPFWVMEGRLPPDFGIKF